MKVNKLSGVYDHPLRHRIISHADSLILTLPLTHSVNLRKLISLSLFLFKKNEKSNSSSLVIEFICVKCLDKCKACTKCSLS